MQPNNIMSSAIEQPESSKAGWLPKIKVDRPTMENIGWGVAIVLGLQGAQYFFDK